MNNTAPRIVRVDITPSDIGGLSVNPIWDGVDRPNTGGWVVKTRKQADRLAAALMAGVVYRDAKVNTDVDGNTYVHGTSLVSGRTLNADLRRLGF